MTVLGLFHESNTAWLLKARPLLHARAGLAPAPADLPRRIRTWRRRRPRRAWSSRPWLVRLPRLHFHALASRLAPLRRARAADARDAAAVATPAAGACAPVRWLRVAAQPRPLAATARAALALTPLVPRRRRGAVAGGRRHGDHGQDRHQQLLLEPEVRARQQGAARGALGALVRARGAASRHRAPQIRTKQESLAKEFTAAQAAHEELTTRVAEAKAARPDTARRHRCDCQHMKR